MKTNKNSLSKRDTYWFKTKSLMAVTLSIWVFFSIILHFFVDTLNKTVVAGFPLGFYMAAQGSLIIFVGLLFWYSGQQEKIDQKFGVSED